MKSIHSLAAVVAAVASLCAVLPAAVAGAAQAPAFVGAAIADTGRPEADRQRDANRMPAVMLGFAEVKPGGQIAELLPGGGYFTRLFSKAVGATGHVYALVPSRDPAAAADAPDFSARIKALAAEPAYGNVSVVVQPFSQLKVPAPVDLVWTSQNYHDLHNFPGMDVVVFNQLIFDALKPGGLYVVLDHAAEPGSGLRDTKTLHRIDPEAVKREVLAAGFKFVGSSDALRQASDPHTMPVFDASVRGNTDQFVLKFRKPAKP